MKELLVGNAPCSWGTLEHQDQSQAIPFDPNAGRTGGDGLHRNGVGRLGLHAHRPGAAERGTGEAESRGDAGRVCAGGDEESAAHAEGVASGREDGAADRRGGDHAGAVPGAGRRQRAPIRVRTKLAGRVRPSDGLSKDEWKTFAGGADRIARAVFDETGLRTVFHHHCAGYVETPDEIATLLELDQPGAAGTGVRRRPLRSRHGPRGDATWSPRSIASRSASGTST